MEFLVSSSTASYFWSLIQFAAALTLVITTFFINGCCYAESAPHTHIPHLDNETDHLALLAFKSQIFHDPNNVLGSWNHSSHFCTWAGITCSGRHPQRVRALQLAAQRLSGYFSPHIANLSFLATLNLSVNGFQGEIPNQLISRLRRLRYLILFSNSFSGQLPQNLTTNSELRVLDLYDNKLQGNLPHELGSLPKLHTLLLAQNNLSGFIPPSLGNLSSLTHLYLLKNNLEGSIVDDIGRLVKLKELVIGFNEFSGVMPSSLYNLSHLSVIDVTSLHIHGMLPHDLGHTLPSLTELDLSNNLFTGPVPISLVNATRLVYVELGANNFTGTVPSNLGGLENLYWFEIGMNSIGGDLHFITSLTNCTNLKVLDVGENRLSGALPKSIANFSTRLEMLLMWRNQLYGNIPRGIEKLSSLTWLGLHVNFLIGIIDVGFGELQNLRKLSLFDNKLIGKVPDSLGNLTQLSHLHLGNNHLGGAIPSSLGKCENLQFFVLSNNNFNGIVPPWIFNISTILEISVDRNSLAGPFVLYITKFSQIVLLDISNNNFSGEIPSALGDGMNLKELRMGGNSFQGSIPSSLSALKGLQLLDLSHNNLSGRIPKFLERLGEMKYLNLSFNNLEGELPKHEIFANSNRFSVLGNNKLCGGLQKLELPPCPIPTSHRKGFNSLRVIIYVVVGVAFGFSMLMCFLANYYWREKINKVRHFIASFIKDPFPLVTYQELLKATDGFSTSNLIGVGSFSYVYKGIINHIEEPIAVKVLNLQQPRASKSFVAECNALRSCRHRNIVKILTVCTSIDFGGNDFKALIFEYMPNGSLDQWLHGDVNEHHSRNLTLIQRVNIAIDVASALDYLHNHCHEQVIHCDLKPSNVLLDGDMIAHVSDFGLARILFKDVTKFSQIHSTSLMKGSIGYIAPEYGTGAAASIYGDVFSYGILLLEMLSRKKPTDEMFRDNFNIHEFAKMVLPERVLEFVDHRVVFEDNEAISCSVANIQMKSRVHECLVLLVRLGISCSVEIPTERLAIKDILIELHRIRNIYHGNVKN